MGLANNMYDFTMFFRNGDVGWDEQIHLKATSYATARSAAATISAFRMTLSPSVVELVYARINKSGAPRDGLPLELDYPLAGDLSHVTEEHVDSVNDPGEGMLIRFSTIFDQDTDAEIAKSVNHTIRGIPDSAVSGKRIVALAGTPIVVTVPSSTPTAVDTSALYGLAVGKYIKILLSNTRYSSKVVTVGDSGPVVAYNTENWSEAVFRGYTYRKCGRPFTLHAGRAAAR